MNANNDKGYIILPRSFFKNKKWQTDRAFSEAEAWLDLIQSARYESTEITSRIGCYEVTWGRGEFPASYRMLSARWGRSVGWIKSLLVRLKRAHCITSESRQGITVIRICDYRLYSGSTRVERSLGEGTDHAFSGQRPTPDTLQPTPGTNKNKEGLNILFSKENECVLTGERECVHGKTNLAAAVKRNKTTKTVEIVETEETIENVEPAETIEIVEPVEPIEPPAATEPIESPVESPAATEPIESLAATEPALSSAYSAHSAHSAYPIAATETPPSPPSPEMPAQAMPAQEAPPAQAPSPATAYSTYSKEAVKAVAAHFNSAMEHRRIPRIITLSERRRRAVGERLGEHGMQTVLAVIRRAADSRFLNGCGEKGWHADFDWIFRPNNFIKILEGNYDNPQPATTSCGTANGFAGHQSSASRTDNERQRRDREFAAHIAAKLTGGSRMP